MSISHTLNELLVERNVSFEVISHRPSASSLETAQLAHVPGDRLAKGVMLRDGGGYVLAVVPATHEVDLHVLNAALDRELTLVPEGALGKVFGDCDVGALPPTGPAYGVETVVDERLLEQPEVYLEAGDHREVIRVDHNAFRQLMYGALQGRFSNHL